MLLANETVASYLEAQDAPALYRIHEEPDVLKVEEFEEFVSRFGYSLGAPLTALRPRHFQRLLERIAGQARGEADRVPDAADDAEGAVRAGEPRPLRPGGASYTHFTSPIRRYPDLVVHRALRAARHATLIDDAARGAGRGSAGDRAPHVRDGAARRRCRARAAAVEEGAVHGRQGRRRVRGLHHRRRGVRPVRRADRALRRRPGARLDHGRRLLPVRRERAHAARREHAEGVSAWRQGERAGGARRHGRRQIDLGLVEILERCGRGSHGPAPKPRHAETERRAASSGPGGGRGKERKAEVGVTSCDLDAAFFHSFLEILDALPMPFPSCGRRLAPKINTTITRITRVLAGRDFPFFSCGRLHFDRGNGFTTLTRISRHASPSSTVRMSDHFSVAYGWSPAIKLAMIPGPARCCATRRAGASRNAARRTWPCTAPRESGRPRCHPGCAPCNGQILRGLSAASAAHSPDRNAK